MLKKCLIHHNRGANFSKVQADKPTILYAPQDIVLGNKWGDWDEDKLNMMYDENRNITTNYTRLPYWVWHGVSIDVKCKSHKCCWLTTDNEFFCLLDGWHNFASSWRYDQMWFQFFTLSIDGKSHPHNGNVIKLSFDEYFFLYN